MKEKSTDKIGVATATIIGMNAMIGAGIFSAPAAMAAHVGPAGILAYVFVVISVWFIASSLARLSALYPQEGSFYVYTKQWGGHSLGMIAGFSYLIGLLIAMGLLAQMAGSYLVQFFPNMSAQILGFMVLVVLVLLNMFGAVLSEIGQQVLICTTLFPLVVITIMCLTKIDLSNLHPFAPYGYANVFKATRVIIFGFFGFESAASLFNIIKDPERNVPRALTYSIAIVGSVYILFVASLILSTPLQYFTDANTPITQTLAIVFPHSPWILMAVHIAILSAIVGTIHSMIWGSSALLVSLTKKIKSSLVKPFIQLRAHRQQTMAVSVVGLCILLSGIFLKNLDMFFNLTATFIVSAYLLSMITLLTIRAEWKSGQNIKTVIGMVTALIMLYFAIEGLLCQLLCF